MICNKHKITLTYRAGKENELFCKQCEKQKRKTSRISKIKKSFWRRLKFW